MTQLDITPRQLVNRFGIDIACDWTDHNPNMDLLDMNHWRCTLTRRDGGRRKQLTVVFSMGYAHTGQPTAEQIIECLAANAAGIENAQDFDDWASEYGYDPDSRAAEKTYHACQREATKLRRFLGETLYDIALWNMHDC